MTLLIATDEAGYGPLLGPLVIAATAWRLRPGGDLAAAEHALRTPLRIDGIGSFQIDDSKKIFKRGKANSKLADNVSSIDRITDAVAHWVSHPIPSRDLPAWFKTIAGDDFQSLITQPWFRSLADENAVSSNTANDPTSDAMIRHWSQSGLELVGVQARIIDAARFNAMLDQSRNKAEILSEATCGLAVRLLGRTFQKSDGDVMISSDRFGGRAYYAGLVQHHCPDYHVTVISQSGQNSHYRLTASEPPVDQARLQKKRTASPRPTVIDWSFTVNGDSFPPVAMSSIIAKSTRERLMHLLNRYFQTETSGYAGLGDNLKPTAGYTVDAIRFLHDIRPYQVASGIDDRILKRNK